MRYLRSYECCLCHFILLHSHQNLQQHNGPLFDDLPGVSSYIVALLDDPYTIYLQSYIIIARTKIITTLCNNNKEL